MVELIKIVAVFLLIVVLTIRRVNLWISLLAGTILLGFLFHLSSIEIVKNLLSAVVDKDTLFLIGALVAILFFSNLLRETGHMTLILDGFRHLLKDIRVVIALLPAIIGLMPIIGGALVTAPMVVPGCDELKLSPERRTFINYWFRHLWEYVLPTYPSLVLAATLIGIPLRQLSGINLPFTIAAILSGILVGYWGIPKPLKGDKSYSEKSSRWALFKNLCPLFFALLLVVVFKVELIYAFGVTILGIILLLRIDRRKVLKGFRESLSWDLVLTVAIVMGFKKVLESSQAIIAVSTVLSTSRVPFWLIAMFIPFIIGGLTGLTIAPVGIGFPILIPLLRKEPGFFQYMALAFGSGICGVLLSPLHLCLVLTKDYFRAEWSGVYRLVWIPVTAILMVGVIITFFH